MFSIQLWVIRDPESLYDKKISSIKTLTVMKNNLLIHWYINLLPRKYRQLSVFFKTLGHGWPIKYRQYKQDECVKHECH